MVVHLPSKQTTRVRFSSLAPSEIFFLLCYNTVMDKARFLKVYANLPINLRNEVILVLENYGPITWNVAFVEIDNNTQLGKIILEKLINLKIV